MNLTVTDGEGNAIADPITISTTQNASPLAVTIRLTANGGDFDCEDLAVQEGGIATISAYAESDGTPIANISTYTIPAGDYITVTIALDRDTVGAGQTGAIQFNGEQAGFDTVDVNYSVTVTAAMAGGFRSRLRNRSR